MLLAAAACGDNHSVGEAPEATLDPAVQTVVNEDGSVSFTIPIQGDPAFMSFAVSTKPAHGSVSGTGPQFLYSPGGDFAGKDSFRITVTDMQSKKQTIVPVFIGIDAVNDPPVAHDDQFTTAEDTDLVIPTSAVLANDVDIDSKLTVVAVTQPESPKLCHAAFGCGQPSVTLDGDKITYHPYYNFNGSETFTYTVSDGEYTSTANVTVRVSSVNDAPLAFDYGPVNITDDKDYTVSVGELASLRSWDPDGDDTFVTGVSSATGGTVKIDDGVVVFTPAKYSPPSSSLINTQPIAGFDFTVSDGHLTATAHASLSVEHINHDPVANPDTYELDQDTTVEFDLSDLVKNDTDVDGDKLTFYRFDTFPEHGQLYGSIATPMGTVYQPEAGYYGDDSFDYQIFDAFGAIATGTVHFKVKHVNHKPVANNDMFSTAQDKPLTFNVSDLLTNDTDPDDKDTFTVTSTTLPEHGVLAWDKDTGVLTYTPSMDGGPADDSFSYTITDAGGLTSTAMVYITVGQPNHAPTAGNDSFGLTQDTVLTFGEGDLFVNDSDPDADDTFSFSKFTTLPASGELATTSTGFTYTPVAGFTGTDTAVYEIKDAAGLTSTATITFTVSAKASSKPPVPNNGYLGNYWNCDVLDITVSATDPDTDASNLTYAVKAVSVGNILQTGSNTFRYFGPCGNQNDFVTFDWTVTDDDNNTADGHTTFDIWLD